MSIIGDPRFVIVVSLLFIGEVGCLNKLVNQGGGKVVIYSSVLFGLHRAQ